MYILEYATNSGWDNELEFLSLEAAVNDAKRMHVVCTIRHNGKVVATVSPRSVTYY